MKYIELATKTAVSGIEEWARGNFVVAAGLLRDSCLYYVLNSEMNEQPICLMSAYQFERASLVKFSAECHQEIGDFPAAVYLFQQAADLFALTTEHGADREAAECASCVLDCIRLFNRSDLDRLALLTVRHEFLQRRYELQTGCKREEAQCAHHIARIYQRRDRFEQSVARYLEAIDLYFKAGNEIEDMLAMAECHQRLGSIQAYKLQNMELAQHNFRLAITLYALYEPLVYDKQEARLQCERALLEIDQLLKKHP